MQQETTVIIVGAGPAGLATSACLNLQNIPNIVLEKEDCCASLWKKRAYDRLKLHLAKQFCELPNMPFPPDAPTYVSKSMFIKYVDDYVAQFNVSPLYNCRVVSAKHDGKWVVEVEDEVAAGTREVYKSKFLVVATGENGEGFVPQVPGLISFNGEVMHSCCYDNGKRFEGKNVLVVGCGNSGMEIAFDLCNNGAHASVVVRSPMHVMTEEMVRFGMQMLKYVPVDFVDNLVHLLSKWKYGDLSKYGIQRPSKGPFYLKKATGRSPVIDVGTIAKIISQEIKVLPSVSTMNGDLVHFSNDEMKRYDDIIFATGYRSTVRKWLKDDGGLFNEDGMPKRDSPNGHWKGEKGLYCAGFAQAGLFGISNDAKVIAQDISATLENVH